MAELSDHIVSGGGGGLPISAYIPLKQDAFVVEFDDSTWLRSGVIETDTSKYPLAPIEPFEINRAGRYVLSGYTDTFSAIANKYALSNSSTVNTKGDLLWRGSGADVVEFKVDGTLTGRKHLIGQSVKAVGYNPDKNALVVLDTLWQISEVEIDTGEKLRLQTPIDWASFGVVAASLLSICYDGQHYVAHTATHVNSRSSVLVYLDMDLNFIAKKVYVHDTNSSTQISVKGMDIDIENKVIYFTMYYANGSQFKSDWEAVDYDLKRIWIDGTALIADDNVIGAVNVAPVLLRDYGLLLIIGQRGTTLLKTNQMKYEAWATNTLTGGITMFTDSGGFGWGLNPSTKTIFKHTGGKGKISYFGQSYVLSGITGVVYDFCGTSAGNLWVLDGDRLIREYNLLGVATGRTFALDKACRSMVTDGDYVYTITYNITVTEVTKWNGNGDIVEVFLRPNVYKIHTAANHLAFNGELWIAFSGAYRTSFFDRDFNYLGEENEIAGTQAHYRPTWPNGYSILGNIIYLDSTYVYYSYPKGRSIIRSVGMKTEIIDSAGFPVYMRVK